MNLTSYQSRIKTLRPGDPDFLLKDGFVMSPRAGFEVSNHCPREYRLIISECIDNGWIKPVAHMMDYEYTMDKLKETE